MAQAMENNPELSSWIDAMNENEKLRAKIDKMVYALKRAEQTIRNLGNGALAGDWKEIALNEARNIREALEVGNV